MSELMAYHPPEYFEVFEGCGIRIRPLTGRPYTMSECDGVVKVRFRDAEGREWDAPQAVWFKLETDEMGALNVSMLLHAWIKQWSLTLPKYAGIEQVIVKAPRGNGLWPGLRRTLVHGHLFATLPFPFIWGTVPSAYPPAPTGLLTTYRDLK